MKLFKQFVSDEAIHADVFSATDVLEKESEALIRECESIINDDAKERYTLLADCGFVNSASVKPHRETINNAEQAKRTLELIEEYRKEYPLKKFITGDVAQKICEKYDLYMGRTRHYIGEIPEKNQREVVEFKKKLNEHMRRDAFDVYRIAVSVFSPFGLNHFSIIAPISMFREKDEYGGNVIDKKNRKVIYKSDDPIVLYSVCGGYIIVSAWGKESNDVAVQNEALN